ncbi:hypothetical protein CIB48_g9766 [Xylaria polymorpha]|nr:hypothetical protein CIB48_g9766 [Xylaria polymorpha]
MGSIRGLLLLPLPPQRVTYSHIETALYPPIRATISSILKAGGASGTSILEIAVPVTRLSEEADTHDELFTRARPLVANIYRLIAATCEELSIPPTGPGSVDIRALFVQDDTDSAEGEKSIPFAVLGYATLAISSRGWTHMFAVGSEPGEQTFRKFCDVAREYGPKRDILFADVRRVAGGMQIYDPSLSCGAPNAVLEATHPFPCEIVVLISGDISDQYSDKYLLTMALFAIPRRARGEHTFADEIAQGVRYIRVVIYKAVLHDNLKTRITDFFTTATDKVCSNSTQATPDEGHLYLRFTTWDEFDTSSSDLERSFIVSDGEKEFEDILRKKGAAIMAEPINQVDN